MAMSLPKLDGAKKGTAARKDRVMTWLNQVTNNAEKTNAPAPSARDSAEQAIRHFQRLFFELTFDQAKEAYIKLLAGRGFNQPGVNAEKTTQAASAATATGEAIPKKKEAHDSRG